MVTGLAASLSYGAASELLRRSTTSHADSTQPVMMTEANITRLVSKLSQMRGAALKLGQFMSIQGAHPFVIFYLLSAANLGTRHPSPTPRSRQDIPPRSRQRPLYAGLADATGAVHIPRGSVGRQFYIVRSYTVRSCEHRSGTPRCPCSKSELIWRRRKTRRCEDPVPKHRQLDCERPWLRQNGSHRWKLASAGVVPGPYDSSMSSIYLSCLVLNI